MKWMKDGKSALTKSVILHVILIAFLLISMELDPHSDMVAQPQLQPDVDIVQAVAVDESRLQEQVQHLEQQREAERRAEEERVAELERRAQEAEQRREREQQAATQAQREREQRERESQQAAEEAERERQEAERLRQQREEEERRAEAERQRREEERRQQEEERRRQEEEARRRAEREQQIEERLAAEREERARAHQQRVMTEVERYQALIRQTIQRNWIVDPSMAGKSCQLRITLARDGFVTDVRIGEGDRAVCESARAAVMRAGSLPMSDDPDVYSELRDITLRVEPQFN